MSEAQHGGAGKSLPATEEGAELEEYLEKHVIEAYHYELDQEENIIRSLPFFVAALALIATVLGLLRNSFPVPQCSAYVVFVYGCGGFLMFLVGRTFWFLWNAARYREHKYITGEDKVLTYAAELAAYHQTSPGSKPVQPAVISDLRYTLIAQYCQATLNNRNIHWTRAVARSKAVIALMFALLMTFILVFAILLHDVITR